MYGRAKNRRERHIDTELLSTYLDGQVTPQERGQVEQHLRACAGCADELRTLRYATTLLAATPPVRVPRAFTLSEADIGRTYTTRKRTRRLSFYLQGATAMVAALLVVVVVGDVFMFSGSGRLPAPTSAPASAPATVRERVVLETVVVEAEKVAAGAELMRAAPPPEAFEEAAAMPAEAAALQEPGDAVSKDASFEGAVEDVVAMPVEAEIAAVEAPEAEAEMQALAVTPEERVLGIGGGGEPETAEPLAMKAVDTQELAREDAVSAATEQAQPRATPAPQPTPEPMAVAIAPTVAAETAAPQTASQPTAEPQPLAPETAAPETAAPKTVAELLARLEQSPSFWTATRVAEFSLGGLFLVLLGLALWLRQRG